MNVPRIQYDPNGDPLSYSKSPNRFRNNHFSPNQSRGRDGGQFYNSSVRSPPGRNMSNNYSTINNSINNLNSMEMTSPMSSINKNYMMYPGNEMSNSIVDMSQYNPHAPQYMLSMSTNINLGIFDENAKAQKGNKKQQSNVKKSLVSRGNFRKTKRIKKTTQGVQDYYMK